MARSVVFALTVSTLLAVSTVLAVLIAGLVPTAALAGDEKNADGPPPVASDQEAADALAIFKVNWKARGLKGDDKLSQRDWALRQIAPIQHPDIVKAIGKVTRSGDEDLRLLGLIYLADQKAYPHQAGKHVLDSMRKNKKDIVLMMTGLQTLGELKYLGAKKEIAALLKHNYFVIRKTAITAVGEIGDLRLLNDLLKILGFKAEKEAEADTKDAGGETEVEPGYSWEGASAEVDRGESDNTQENADAKKQAEAKIAANKAAAQGKAGGSSGGNTSGAGGGGSSSGGGGRGASGRSTDELTPTIMRTLQKLTGEAFYKPSEIRRWLKDHKKDVKEREKALDGAEKEQKARK